MTCPCGAADPQLDVVRMSEHSSDVAVWPTITGGDATINRPHKVEVLHHSHAPAAPVINVFYKCRSCGNTSSVLIRVNPASGGEVEVFLFPEVAATP